MGNGLKKIINEFGVNALNFPDDLANAMREQGMEEKEILTVVMILKCCPSVAGVLTRGSASDAEVNALIRSAVLKTGLSVSSVRQTLGMLMHACGFEITWAPSIMFREKRVDVKVMPMTIEEGETLEQLQERIVQDPERAEALSDLHLLAEQGSAGANYALGKFYKVMDDQYHTEIGRPYFQKAADCGYGPAFGALAAYMIRGEKKQMDKIADCFQNPTALAGNDGREWANLSSKILKYREENQKRLRTSFFVQLAMLVLSVVIMILAMGNGAESAVLPVLALLGQLGCLGWTMFSRIFKPYNTGRYAYFVMTLSWICLVAGLM